MSILNPFGWDFPPGAEHDPNAPYNQPDLDYCVECERCFHVNDLDYDTRLGEPLCKECRKEYIREIKQKR